MWSMIGSSARPLSVSAYSTRGGTSGNVWRATMPSSSRARRRSDSVRGLIPASERSSSQKREQPSARSRTSRSVHFPHTMSAVRHTGHVPLEAISAFTLPTEVAGLADGRGRASGRRSRPWRVLAVRAPLLGLGDVLHGRAPASFGLHQQLEVVRARGHAHGVLERDAPRLDVTEERLVERLHAVVAARGDHLDEVPRLSGV